MLFLYSLAVTKSQQINKMMYSIETADQPSKEVHVHPCRKRKPSPTSPRLRNLHVLYNCLSRLILWKTQCYI